MRNGGVDNLLKRLLSFDLLIQHTKSHIFEIHYVSIFSIVLYLFLEDTEDKLLLILCLVCCKVDVCLLISSLHCIRTFKKFSFYRLFLFFEGIEKVFVLKIFWNNVYGVLFNLALVLNAYELYPIWWYFLGFICRFFFRFLFFTLIAIRNIIFFNFLVNIFILFFLIR